MLNLTPEWKISKPESFTNKLMEEIHLTVAELKAKKYDIAEKANEISPDLAYKLSCLTESLKAIISISKTQFYNPVVFSPKNLNTIATLLDVIISLSEISSYNHNKT